MLEVVDLFREQGTIDELGIGVIRDTISELLFPGTSTLHRRLKYVLFIPWLMREAGRRGTPEEMRAEFQRLEIRLIESLLAGGEYEGVIGNTARDRLKLMPSSMYWSALGIWRLRSIDTLNGFFRRQYDLRALGRRAAVADDPEARDDPPASGLDPELPATPPGLLESTDFVLTAEQEAYLSDRIVEGTSGTALSWLVLNPPRTRAAYVWEIDNLGDIPPQVAEQIDHARRFSLAIAGSHQLYGLMLAERTQRPELIEKYRTNLAGWQQEAASTGVIRTWDRGRFWHLIRTSNPRLRTPTQAFVDDWVNRVTTVDDITQDAGARALLERRERRIKGSRARLANQSALDRWNGDGTMWQHSFRWPVTRSHLNDLVLARQT